MLLSATTCSFLVVLALTLTSLASHHARVVLQALSATLQRRRTQALRSHALLGSSAFHTMRLNSSAIRTKATRRAMKVSATLSRSSTSVQLALTLDPSLAVYLLLARSKQQSAWHAQLPMLVLIQAWQLTRHRFLSAQLATTASLERPLAIH